MRIYGSSEGFVYKYRQSQRKFYISDQPLSSHEFFNGRPCRWQFTKKRGIVEICRLILLSTSGENLVKAGVSMNLSPKAFSLIYHGFAYGSIYFPNVRVFREIIA